MRKLVWSGVMLCGLLAGCAGRQDTGTAPVEPPPAEAEASAEVSAPAPEDTQATEIPPAEEGEAKAAVQPLVVTPNPEPKDPINIRSAKVDGGILTVAVMHGGGCAEHTYSLAWDGNLQQGVDGTPVANLVLVHDGNNDRCKALLRASPRFDVSSVSQRFGAQFGKTSGTVNLVLSDQAQVRYDF
ncbi:MULTISPECIES: hypothetical protein [Myxococcus]|uniref:Lipoprotein n=1 Tax=Myxococcus xanthus TaxID=34 RepID=A0AAE6G470_MYXXA|nr:MULTISPECIES: hypothetical protein [Myxococcus]QDE70289.1 hypothetical protein BHS09_26790 [Myxococcus xanthus]QDE77568.1 hypothetical protein BHS08_26810 [Myxococcus xanthus]QDE84955.1 hypothetical protein BHS07_27355 [Myxococcus xanthus]QDE99111.1 hypothetical protein BHS05_26605 [Myxococcus xanthus]QDF06790.1 hypothetical protein BHS04_26905 [Myxococcus xanthus]